MRRAIIGVVLIIIILIDTIPGSAQTQPDYPVYIVQSGDTVGVIAQRFGVPVSALISVNALADPNSIAIGMQLKIPGLEGIHGTLITQPVPLGETFESMAARYQVSNQILARLNRVTSPQELYAGASLVLPQDKETGTAQPYDVLGPGETILEKSAGIKENPWTTILTLRGGSTADEVPGKTLFSKKIDVKNEISPIASSVKSIQISPLPIVQGKTIVIRVQTLQPLILTGTLAGNKLHFFQEKENSYVALQGIHAMAFPGLANFTLNGSSNENSRFSYQSMVILKAGYYPNDPPLSVDPETTDPAVTQPEDAEIAKIVAPATPDKRWAKIFKVPVDQPVCYKSTFGNRRSYNGGPFSSFHGGTDFGVCANLNIYAPAEGVVVFAGPLTVRGNATIIDHGWGVYSGYWHQKEILVKVGDQVKAGQLIGYIGATGRVTGPHLHWEMIVNGVQVEPVDWLQKVYP